MKKITLILFLIILAALVSSSELIPQGAISGVGIRRIYNFTNISSDKLCDDLGVCINTSKLIEDTDLNAVNNSDNIQALYSDTLFHSGGGLNGTLNSSNIINTPTACSVSNSFMTRYLGASSTCTAIDFDDVETARLNITDTLNMTNRNATNIQCLLFESGGKICSGT